MFDLFTKAFALWEEEFRADPSAFLTDAEQAALDVLPLSEQRATCFLKFIDHIVKA